MCGLPEASSEGSGEQDGRRVHTDMELWSEIRRRVLVEGVSKREICRDYKMGWRTLEKILEAGSLAHTCARPSDG